MNNPRYFLVFNNENPLISLKNCNVYSFIKSGCQEKSKSIQSDAEQGSVDLADFHIYSTVFHVDSHGAIRFSYKLSYAGLR